MLRLERASRSPASAAVFGVVATRLPVLIVGAIAVTILKTVPPPAAEALWRVSAGEVPNLLARWDTAFYYSIATQGYSWNPAVFSHQNVVFFPLYPLLMRWGGALLGGRPLVAGLIVSLASFAAAAALVYRLALLDMDDAHAWAAVLLLSTFPYALFFSAAYTESLFLLVTVAAFYSMRRGRLGSAALCGVAAGLTRPNGFWLSLPLLILAWSEGRADRDDGPGPHARLPRVGRGPWSVTRRRLALLAAFAPLAGTVAYSGYLHFRFDDALAWMHGQAAWGYPLLGRSPAPDPLRLPGEPPIKATELVAWAGNFLAFTAAGAAIVPITRRFGPAYGLWVALNIFPPVAAHLFISLGRFTAVLFPLFFWLAIRIPPAKLTQVVAVFAAGQALLAAWFFLWRPVV